MTNEEISKPKDDIVKNFRASSVEDICGAIDERFDAKMKEIKEESESAFTINENDLSGELSKCIYKMHTYMTKLMEERILLNRMSRKKDDVHGEIYGQLKKGEQIRFDSKSEVEEWINRNPKWLKISTYYENQKSICDFYEKLIDGLKQKQWSIRNKTDLKKIELGV
jgi:hypothetical protein